MPHLSRRCCAALLGLGVLVAAAPAAADWLVTRDGGRVETRGPWAVKGKLVVFTNAGGVLASLRLAEVDLERSDAATAAARVEAEAATAPAPPAKRPPVLVLTDKDVAHVEDLGAVPPTGEAGAAAAPEVSAGGLVVTGWSREASSDGQSSAVVGSLRNAGESVAGNIRMSIAVYDVNGELLGTTAATLSTTSLPPGAVANFRADFPGLVEFATARFDLDSLPVVTQPEATTEDEPPPPPQPEEEPAEPPTD